MYFFENFAHPKVGIQQYFTNFVTISLQETLCADAERICTRPKHRHGTSHGTQQQKHGNKKTHNGKHEKESRLHHQPHLWNIKQG